jgi:hypothetical protein
MALQAAVEQKENAYLLGDVPALLLVAVVTD